MTRPALVERLPTPGDAVETTDGARFILGEPLGRGNQGAVFSLRLPAGAAPLCAKIYLGLDDARAARMRTRLEQLRQLPATDQLVLPRKVLRAPKLGYVMNQVIGHSSIGALSTRPSGASVRPWYAEGGGLRRRLLLGLELCAAFRDLHARGLAYCDLSFDNVLVSGDPLPRVRLIDCDNLTLPGTPGSNVAGTPWFIAPEILSGASSPDIFTDVHSLAVLLYHLLVLTHPLLGDAIRTDTTDAEDAALRGRWPGGGVLPWIDAPDDARNRAGSGLPRHLVLSPGIAATFDRAFSDGLHDRTRRPSEGTWAEVLGRAVDAVVGCPACRNTNWLGAGECAWCGKPVAPPTVLVLRHTDGRRPVVVEQRRRLYPRHLLFRRDTLGEAPLAEVGFVGDQLTLESRAELAFDLRSEDGRAVRVEPGARAPLALGDVFRLGPKGVEVEVQHVGAKR
ncbi:MAG: hypothetical protein V4850_17750 [Myxococcota bacterium]